MRTLFYIVYNIMGSGSSAAALPEKLSEEDLRRFCGNKFVKEKFEALKDDEGFVRREMFLVSLSEGQDKEVFDLFMCFCPDGQMDSRTFVKLCRDTKLLNKKDLTSPDADIIFQKVKSRLLSTSKTINFESFRSQAIPEIALKKGLPVSDIVYKLSRADGPVLTGVTQTSNVGTFIYRNI